MTNKFSANLNGSIINLTIKDRFFRWLLNKAYPNTSIVKDVVFVGGEFRAKNLFPLGSVSIDAGVMDLDPKGFNNHD